MSRDFIIFLLFNFKKDLPIFIFCGWRFVRAHVWMLCGRRVGTGWALGGHWVGAVMPTEGRGGGKWQAPKIQEKIHDRKKEFLTTTQNPKGHQFLRVKTATWKYNMEIIFLWKTNIWGGGIKAFILTALQMPFPTCHTCDFFLKVSSLWRERFSNETHLHP